MTKLKLTAERERHGWTRTELARRARLDQGLVGKIEARRIVPYPKQLKQLARALGVSKESAETLLEDASGPEAV